MVKKIVLLSDTHNLHKQIKTVPEGDILIHAGDFSGQGTLSETKGFLHWFNQLPHQHKLFISGNHDWMAERNPQLFKSLLEEYPDLTYLHETSVNIDGLSIYGSPYTPEFCNWAFNIKRGNLTHYWNKIPSNTNILVTHCPPFQVLDYISPQKEHAGCSELAYKLQDLKNLKIHVFGHIHEGYGMKVINNTHFVNASICTGNYKPINLPLIIDL